MTDIAAAMAAELSGDVPPLAYRSEDMAADAIGLLDAIGIARAHVVGMSLGGMIAEQMAIDHVDRLLSLAIAKQAVPLLEHRLCGRVAMPYGAKLGEMHPVSTSQIVVISD